MTIRVLSHLRASGLEPDLGDRQFDLTERNLNYHVEIVAPTGSGKTNLLKNLIANRIAEGHGVIFLDFKAEFEMVSWIYRAAQVAGREKDLRLLSLSDPNLSMPYNPFKYGDPTDVHSALMNALTWSEPFYRSVSSEALLLVVHALYQYREKTGEHYHLGHIYRLLDDPRVLVVFADRLQALSCSIAPKVRELADRLQKPKEKSNLMGLLANLNQILFSSAGDLLSKDVIAGSFDFRDSIPKGEIVVMLMNSLKLKESAQVVGKLILQDLMSYVGNYYGKSGVKTTKPISLVIDEFAGFATPQFIEFMDRARGAGIGIVFSHQSRADLRQISPEFQERVEANSNTVLVSGVKNPDDAEFYASILGTQSNVKDTLQIQESLIFGDSATGGKSRREVEEFILHPNRIKGLTQGELLAICRTVDPQWSLVKVPKANEFSGNPVSDGIVQKYFEEVRQVYFRQEGTKYLNLESLDASKPQGPPKAEKGWK